MNTKQTAFIQKILDGAMAAQKKTGILTSLTLAQAALESGWGNSSIGNNIFGIKATASWKGKKRKIKTAEYSGGKKGYYDLWFRDYDTIEDSILDHGKLLTYPRYAKVRAAKTYAEACRAIQAAGYATDPKYAEKLISLIKSNGLDKWDNAEAPEVKPAPKPMVLKEGSKGETVEMLQLRLSQLGYPLKADGDFGPTTKAAVLKFQQKNKIMADGVVGPETQKVLNRGL